MARCNWCGETKQSEKNPIENYIVVKKAKKPEQAMNLTIHKSCIPLMKHRMVTDENGFVEKETK